MCLPLVARVCSLDAEQAEIELLSGGGLVRVSAALYPEVGAGQHVLVDRGLIIELIEPEQAESLLAFYAELEQAWDAVEETADE